MNTIKGRIACPIPGYNDKLEDGSPVYFIQLPAEWIGQHAIRYETAVRKLRESGSIAGQSGTMLTFAGALAVLDDFHLPGVKATREGIEFEEIKLGVVGWINHVVIPAYSDNFDVKKNFWSPSSNGSTDRGKTGAIKDGS